MIDQTEELAMLHCLALAEAPPELCAAVRVGAAACERLRQERDAAEAARDHTAALLRAAEGRAEHTEALLVETARQLSAVVDRAECAEAAYLAVTACGASDPKPTKPQRIDLGAAYVAGYESRRGRDGTTECRLVMAHESGERMQFSLQTNAWDGFMATAVGKTLRLVAEVDP